MMNFLMKPIDPNHQLRSHRVFASLRNHPVYYFFLLVATLLSLRMYIVPDPTLFLLDLRDVLSPIFRWAVVFIFTAIIFSNLPTFEKRKYLVIALGLLWIPGMFLAVLAAPFLLVMALGHFILLIVLLFVAERSNPDLGRLVMFAILFVCIVVLGFIRFIDAGDAKERALFNQMSESLHLQVLSGQLTDPVVIQQKCLELNRKSHNGNSCRYDEFAVKTGDISYCNYEITTPGRSEYWIADCAFKVLKTTEEKAAYCRKITSSNFRTSCFDRLPSGTK